MRIRTAKKLVRATDGFAKDLLFWDTGALEAPLSTIWVLGGLWLCRAVSTYVRICVKAHVPSPQERVAWPESSRKSRKAWTCMFYVSGIAHRESVCYIQS